MTFMDWLTNTNNPLLDQSEYLYGTRHIVLLVITAILCVLVGLIFRKKSEKTKNGFFHFCATILLFFEISTRVVNLWFASSYTLASIAEIILPMHICSVIVWTFIVGIYSDSKLLLNYSTIVGLLSTLAFLLYPAVGINQKYMAFTNVYSTFSHMLGFILAISLMTLRKVEFRFKKIWQPYLCLVVMFTWGYLLNWVIFPGNDYMYMRNDPLGLDLNFPYQYLYGSILVVYVFMFYFVNLFTRKKVRNEASSTNIDNVIDELSSLDEDLKELMSEKEVTMIVTTKRNDGELSSKERTILEIISNNTKANKKQIALDAKMSDYEVDKHIKHLKEIGKLERVGPGNGGYWKVN